MMVFDRDDVAFTVVINHEEQYSIWPTFKDVPKGWTAVGVTGSKKECLDHIEQVWTDMRPLSLRKFMQDGSLAPAES
jgi:MbtH protein